MDVLSMVNPMEHELRHMNDVNEREKAQKAHDEFENLADEAPKVLRGRVFSVRARSSLR